MGTSEWKVRFCGMIEGLIGPAFLAMAALAILTVTAQMDITQLVATTTPGVGKAVLIPGVTTATLQGLVVSLKRELGTVVIEVPGFAPTLRRVAILALPAQGLAMLVLFLMAAVACPGGFPKRGIGHMAVCTGRTHVFACQGKIGVLMIKNILVQRHNIVVSSQVVSMAALATAPAGHRGTTVKTGFLIAIGSDLLMAFQAQRILGGFIKAAMAGLAILLFFGMCVGKRAGHKDHRFQVQALRIGSGDRQKKDQNHDDNADSPESSHRLNTSAQQKRARSRSPP